MGDLLDGRQAKRLSAPVLAGLTPSTMVGSFASEPLSRVGGTHGLFPFSAGDALDILRASLLDSIPEFRESLLGDRDI